MKSHSDSIGALLDDVAPGPVLIHSDVFRAMGLVEKTPDPRLLLGRHMDLLRQATLGRDAYFPTFNYEFPRTGKFDPANDVSQVGALSEYARTDWASWRDETPIFSFCGRNRPSRYDRISIPGGEIIDPFDQASLFHHLYRADGAVMMYGAAFDRFTAIHYIERMSGGPVYRYDKYFSGLVLLGNGDEKQVTLKYHVRPVGLEIDYAWSKLSDIARREGFLIETVIGNAAIAVVDFRALCDAWLAMLSDDPLALLDNDSRLKVERECRRLGRRFLIQDFE